MNIIHDIDPKRIGKDKFVVVTEIQKNTRMKYEIDKETGMLALDRILKTSMVYPTNYGFIPRTLSEDGDPLDVNIIMTEEVPPMTIVECVPVGVIDMVDGGERDEKILAIPAFNKFVKPDDEATLKLLYGHIVEELKHFYVHYKDLENKKVEVLKTSGRKEAQKIIEEAIARYNKNKGAKK
ncbi:MAG: inorganic diphosphatase [Firmicutes bacterium]|nr:inorganic diphosphatase [Bacillota bacterium]